MSRKLPSQMMSADLFPTASSRRSETVGPKYGKLLGKIRQMLPALDGAAAMNELKTTGAIHLDVDGTEVVLGEEDLLIETAQTEGCVSEANERGFRSA